MTREPADDAQALLAELVAELAALTEAGARHADHLHSGEEAKKDQGLFLFCPGCRQAVVGRAVVKLLEGRDDTTPGRGRARKSRRDRALEVARRVRT